MLPKLFFGRGKLLLSAEYFVLDGAKALALPTQLGQQLMVESRKYSDASMLIWKSLDEKGELWFKAQFSPRKFHIIHATDIQVAIELQKILRQIPSIGKYVLPQHVTAVTTELDFPITWGLGSSSTLIYAMAKWTNCDPFELLEKTIGGSGYDIACAGATAPILYQKENGTPTWESVTFDPSFKENLYFVYLGKKQSSRKSIQLYREKVAKDTSLVDTFTNFTDAILACGDLETFEKIVTEHEQLLAQTLELERAQDLYFSDYWGTIKSLGGWGGDFVLATSNRPKEETKQYFRDKGFDVIKTYKQLIYNE